MPLHDLLKIIFFFLHKDNLKIFFYKQGPRVIYIYIYIILVKLQYYYSTDAVHCSPPPLATLSDNMFFFLIGLHFTLSTAVFGIIITSFNFFFFFSIIYHWFLLFIQRSCEVRKEALRTTSLLS